MRNFSITIDIAAAPDRVWQVMSDAERWHEWTSVTRIRLRGPMAVASGGTRADLGSMPAMGVRSWALLKDDRSVDRLSFDLTDLDNDEGSSGIRCPLCAWRPSPSSTWCCASVGTPETFSGGCGTIWNTFATRGRCPGCGHQWQWTSCLRCAGWSRHEEWYVEEDEG